MNILTTLRKAGNYLRARSQRKPPAQARGQPYPWEASYPPGINWHFELRPKPLYSLLDDAVATYPKNTCLTFQGKSHNYRKTARLVNKASTGLRGLGVKHGARVGLLLSNSPYFVICYYAILKAGGTVVALNPLYAEREIASQIQDSGMSTIITMDSRRLYPKVAGRLNDTCLKKIIVCRVSGMLRFPHNLLFPWLRHNEVMRVPADRRHVMFDDLIDTPGDFTPPPIDAARDIAVLQYTGGITGTSKGAALTHANLYINPLQLRTWASGVKLGKEKCLAVLPLSHAFGMTGVMNFGLAVGAELVLLARFQAGEVLKAISRHRCTLLFGVPTMYAALSAHRDGQEYDLSSLRYCISGGAPLSPEVKTAFESRAGCSVIDGYGLTEASPVCTLGRLAGRDQPGSVGLPLPGTVIEIMSLVNPKRIVKPGELGEICIRGPQVMAGYWKQPEETAVVLNDGRLRTGDFGYLDDDGYLFIVDRIKEMIISGGFNVYPRMVEDAIRLHPAISQAVVCGVADRHRGQRVKGYVKLCDGAKLSAAELRTFLKDKLAPFEMPSDVEFLTEIPTELLQKVPRQKLLLQKFGKTRSATFGQTVRRLRILLSTGWRI